MNIGANPPPGTRIEKRQSTRQASPESGATHATLDTQASGMPIVGPAEMEGGGRAPVEPTTRPYQWAGLLGGAVALLTMLILPPPPGLPLVGWRMAAVGVLMAGWWMTEAIPISATALIPLVLFPLLGVSTMPNAAAPYANELIFLFMGGFFIAFAMERWNLHLRIALAIVSAVGTSQRRLILGFMLATAFVSMWISNTASTTMMFPIGLALGEAFRPPGQEGPYKFGIALMLGTAYAASIGGLATLIGSPANVVMAGAANEMLGVQIGFLEWMMIGVPLAVFMFPFAWLRLASGLDTPDGPTGKADTLLKDQRRMLGSASRGEKAVGVVFALTALAWIVRDGKSVNGVIIPGIETFAPFVTDATIAIAAALALFLIPVDRTRRKFVLDWPTARRIPWDVLLLFGGGLSLARGMEQSGLALWIGEGIGALGAVPPIVIFAAVALLFVFLTELTSNTATSTMAMPIMAGVAVGFEIAPLTLMAVAALSAGMAFMLPVASPPNAIVFASGYLTIPQMVRAGFWLNICAIALLTILAVTLIPMVVAS